MRGYYNSGSNKTFFAFVIILLFVYIGTSVFGTTVFWVLVGLAVCGFAFAAYASFKNRSTCPQCQARASYRYRHVCMNGSPDMRYKRNPIICVKCGSLAPPPGSN